MRNQQIDKYKIISKLGEGGMAVVYLAKKPPLDIEYALKVLKKEHFQNIDIRNRFISEARKLVDLNHPNILRVHDLIQNVDECAIVLDKISGKTINEIIKTNGPFDARTAQPIFKQMYDAVNYLHNKGYIHRDLKPSNFMITNDNHVFLMDFGIAKNLNPDGINLDYPETNTFVYMGTPIYMSPEQFKSSKNVTHYSDIFSLGVVFWEMLTGKAPFNIIKGDSLFEIYDKVNKNKLTSTNSVWDELISNATKKETFERKLTLPDCVTSQPKLVPIKGEWSDENSTKSFDTITIEEQTWMAKNLSIDHLRNGYKIIEAKDYRAWKQAIIEEKPAWCFYDFKSSNSNFGKLYNFFAIHPKNIKNFLAPSGWRIPRESDWDKLIDVLKKYDIELNQEFLFLNVKNNKALHGGELSEPTAGGFVGLKNKSVWWSSSISERNEFVINQMNCSNGFKKTFKKGKQMGYSVLCIKE